MTRSIHVFMQLRFARLRTAGCLTRQREESLHFCVSLVLILLVLRNLLLVFVVITLRIVFLYAADFEDICVYCFGDSE